MFCLSPLIEYAERYETVAPAMKIAVSFDDSALGKTSFEKRSPASGGIFRPLEKSDIGKTAPLTMRKEGPDRLYYTARIAYGLIKNNRERINPGIELGRESAQEKDGKFVRLTSEMETRRGDLVRVDLFVSVPTARHFVVIDDPVPGGLEIVNSDFATPSRIDADTGEFIPPGDSWFFISPIGRTMGAFSGVSTTKSCATTQRVSTPTTCQPETMYSPTLRRQSPWVTLHSCRFEAKKCTTLTSMEWVCR